LALGMQNAELGLGLNLAVSRAFRSGQWAGARAAG
jgi:hypothetical protein